MTDSPTDILTDYSGQVLDRDKNQKRLSLHFVSGTLLPPSEAAGRPYIYVKEGSGPISPYNGLWFAPDKTESMAELEDYVLGKLKELLPQGRVGGSYQDDDGNLIHWSGPAAAPRDPETRTIRLTQDERSMIWSALFLWMDHAGDPEKAKKLRERFS